MLRLVVLFFLCVATTYTPGHCEARASRDVEHARLPEFLTELDLSSLEASEEDVEALKKIVKRLAPEKNGEYQVYQVFFGNEDLLKEWLKGADVTGQPGVDYPALTSIPTTSFSCRGLRGGYYADLETNCQVFHICDNGRKISFLCPNGTIFQQSQLICDWWFKVDCRKSTELYEQSAEQLAEEEKKRADARKMKSEYHRVEQQDNTDYYETQNVDYDGRQNGRTNPYGQSAVNQNQIPAKQEFKSAQHFRLNNNRDSGRFQENSANALRTNEKTSQTSESFNQQPKQRQYHDGSSNYQTSNRQRNQLVDTQGDGKFNYEQGNKFQDTRQNYQSNAQDYYRPDQNTPFNNNEKPEFRGAKSRPSTRNNLFSSNQSQKSTPIYMETTTFRTTTAVPPREYQQFAESAAFVSNRGNRFNSGKSESNRQFYYHSYDYQDHSTVDYRDQETTTLTAPERNQEAETVSFTPKTNAPSFPGPTFAPIYKPRTTTLPPYETTLQYTPTTETSFYSTSYYGQDDIPETTVYANIATDSTTESYATHSDLQTPAAIGRVPPLAGNYQNQYAHRVTHQRNTDRDTASFATTRPYLNTESYRHNIPANVTSNVSQEEARDTVIRSNYQNENKIADIEIKDTTRDPWRTSSQSFRQNSISSTEKPWKSTNAYQLNGSTSKTLSPYDTSFTYKQGKVLSTLGPYIPFTKNYVYSTMTTTPTPKPSATVPTYSSTLTNYRITANNLLPKMKSLPPVTSRPKDRATYLPEVTSKRPTTLEDRPYAEREHALSMLHSLQGLENNANSLSEISKKSGSDRGVPFAPGPSTLHSLALYFATASDNLNSNETAESIASVEIEGREDDHSRNVSIELPINILTQHTITSYAELFNLNNALEGNATLAEFAAEIDNVASEIENNDDDDDDLDIEQSEGPLNGAKRSNNTKLRELAQVFTHALSAYLQNPDTFKKVLTEIRPTQPPDTTDGGQYETTTLYPITAEEYSSVTKEKDEVLDFSDDTDASRRRKPSTVFPTTLQSSTTTDRSYLAYYTTPYDEYFSTSETRRPIYYPSTTFLPPGTSSSNSEDYIESSTQNGNTFAFEVNRAFTTTTGDIHSYDSDTRDSTDLSPVYDNYFPLYEDGNREKIRGSRNNTARTFQPYGKNVKTKGATPISNYVASSTLASFQQPVETTLSSWSRGSAGDKPVQNLTPPHYQRFGNVKSFEVSNSIVPNQIRSTTPLSRSKPSYDTASTTVQPFRIRYYDSTTSLPEDGKTNPESLVTARSSYVKYRNSYNRIEGTREEDTRKPVGNPSTTAATTIQYNVGTLDPITATVSDVIPYTATVVRATPGKPTSTSSIRHPNSLNNNHWTSSPMVTQLWETTVFVDPQHINHGLQSSADIARSPTTDNIISEESGSTVAATTTRSPTLFTDVDIDGTTEERTTTSTPSPWQWATNGNDSPVTFTLLPTTFTVENTATPTPLITTRSSITTTITSSVTSTNSVPRDNLASNLLPFEANALNATENEVIKAHEMFGKLNETSSNTLIRVMKQADNNETVRQLVLLLISHCNGPRNKTTEQEKEQLLDALLRLPVNEFSSEESREIVAGISRLNLPSGKIRTVILSNSTTTKAPQTSSVRPTPSAPSITTFRSKTGRRFRTTTENVHSFARRSDDVVQTDTNNSLAEDETIASDNRALELLRSLYTIAAKWG
ncbi:mucin-2 isoform X1 [Polyergus mexicanus]|uniref:mucin-2 isoform X1 n=1 Tax=Polyergus mexicanus TaxID=615972 RepID=UPI0038B5C552